MRIRYLALFVSIFFISISNAFAQDDNAQDVVYLKNGRIVRGTITEQVPGETLSIRAKSGHVLTYEMSEVVKITKEEEESDNEGQPTSFSTPSASSESKLELDINAGFSQNNGNFGFGGGGGLFVPLDAYFSLGVMASYYSFNQSTSISGSEYTVSVSNSNSQNMSFVEGLGALKYQFHLADTRAYVFAGVGVVDVLSSASVSSTMTNPYTSGMITTQDSESSFQVSPMIAIGCGIDFSIGANVDVFVQAKESFVIGSVDTEMIYANQILLMPSDESYTILEGGLSFDLASGNTNKGT